MLTIFRTSKDRNQKPDEPGQKPGRPQQQTPPKPPQQNIPPKPQQNIPQQKQPPRPGPVAQRQPAPQMTGATTIGKDLFFEGNVKGKGSIRVEGEFNGKLDVQNEVIIGEGGKVTGDILAEVVTVEGNLKGNVTARQKININVTGTMIGDIIAPRVVVASGAVYKGRIDMEAALKNKNETIKKDAANTKKETPQKNVKPEQPKQEQSKPDQEPKQPNQESQAKIPGPPPKN